MIQRNVLMTRRLSLAALLLSFTTFAGAQQGLEEPDFTVTLNQQPVSLGQPLSDKLQAKLGKSNDDSFVGEVPFGDGNYKFYRHMFNDFDIYSANLWWDTQRRDFDSYIVAQITLRGATSHTARGIAPGSSEDKVTELYGPGEKESSDGAEWIGYQRDNRRISFEIVRGKVNSININYVDDRQ